MPNTKISADRVKNHWQYSKTIYIFGTIAAVMLAALIFTIATNRTPPNQYAVLGEKVRSSGTKAIDQGLFGRFGGVGAHDAAGNARKAAKARGAQAALAVRQFVAGKSVFVGGGSHAKGIQNAVAPHGRGQADDAVLLGARRTAAASLRQADLFGCEKNEFVGGFRGFGGGKTLQFGHFWHLLSFSPIIAVVQREKCQK